MTKPAKIPRAKQKRMMYELTDVPHDVYRFVEAAARSFDLTIDEVRTSRKARAYTARHAGIIAANASGHLPLDVAIAFRLHPKTVQDIIRRQPIPPVMRFRAMRVVNTAVGIKQELAYAIALAGAAQR